MCDLRRRATAECVQILPVHSCLPNVHHLVSALCILKVGMVVVQDPKAELEDKVAGLELLRCMLRFDDTVSLS